MKVVLDTNVIASGVFFHSSLVGRVLDFWLQRRFQVYATRDILEEYQTVIRRLSLKKTPVLNLDWPFLLPKLCIIVPEAISSYPISRDPTDHKFLFCAMRAKVNCPVTGDRDLAEIKQPFSFHIISPSKFLELL
jgi:putative PIN family toxin of toxin-antitoxin system